MWETRPVELVLDLPHDIASTVEEVSHRDPEYLRRVIRYGMARRAVYQSLKRRIEANDVPDDVAPPSEGSAD